MATERAGIQTVARLRPLLPGEISDDGIRVISHLGAVDKENSDPNTDGVRLAPGIYLTNSGSHYPFHSAYGPKQWTSSNSCIGVDDVSSTRALFTHDVLPLVQQVLQGATVTIFAYGVTSSGKTHTMMGAGTPEDPGIIGLVVDELFAHSSSSQHTISMSYLELYLDQPYDLMIPPTQRRKLNILSTASQSTTAAHQGAPPLSFGTSIHLPALSTQTVNSPEAFRSLYADAIRHRSTGATLLNSNSSRSHAVLTFYVTVPLRDGYVVGKLHLLDLAGSENNNLTGNNPQRMKESSAINTSLTALGKVVSQLNDNVRALARAKKAEEAARVKGIVANAPVAEPKLQVISYRSSSLTRLLSDALGGSSLALLIVCLAPATKFRSDLVKSVTFASKARSIEHKPQPQHKHIHPSGPDPETAAASKVAPAKSGNVPTAKTFNFSIPLKLPSKVDSGPNAETEVGTSQPTQTHVRKTPRTPNSKPKTPKRTRRMSLIPKPAGALGFGGRGNRMLNSGPAASAASATGNGGALSGSSGLTEAEINERISKAVEVEVERRMAELREAEAAKKIADKVLSQVGEEAEVEVERAKTEEIEEAEIALLEQAEPETSSRIPFHRDSSVKQEGSLTHITAEGKTEIGSEREEPSESVFHEQDIDREEEMDVDANKEPDEGDQGARDVQEEQSDLFQRETSELPPHNAEHQARIDSTYQSPVTLPEPPFSTVRTRLSSSTSLPPASASSSSASGSDSPSSFADSADALVPSISRTTSRKRKPAESETPAAGGSRKGRSNRIEAASASIEQRAGKKSARTNENDNAVSRQELGRAWLLMAREAELKHDLPAALALYKRAAESVPENAKLKARILGLESAIAEKRAPTSLNQHTKRQSECLASRHGDSTVSRQKRPKKRRDPIDDDESERDSGKGKGKRKALSAPADEERSGQDQTDFGKSKGLQRDVSGSTARGRAQGHEKSKGKQRALMVTEPPEEDEYYPLPEPESMSTHDSFSGPSIASGSGIREHSSVPVVAGRLISLAEQELDHEVDDQMDVDEVAGALEDERNIDRGSSVEPSATTAEGAVRRSARTTRQSSRDALVQINDVRGNLDQVKEEEDPDAKIDQLIDDGGDHISIAKPSTGEKFESTKPKTAGSVRSKKLTPEAAVASSAVQSAFPSSSTTPSTAISSISAFSAPTEVDQTSTDVDSAEKSSSISPAKGIKRMRYAYGSSDEEDEIIAAPTRKKKRLNAPKKRKTLFRAHVE